MMEIRYYDELEYKQFANIDPEKFIERFKELLSQHKDSTLINGESQLILDS